MTHFYDDSDFFYDQYWQTRAYEHTSEVLAIETLLEKKKFSNAADIGGGYGRLSKILTLFAKKVTLVEPSQKQRTLAKKYLDKKIAIQSGLANKTGLAKASMDLVLMVRVMHHLPEPESSLVEINRILKNHGLLILEFANSANFKAKITSFITGRPILPIPIERRSLSNIKNKTIPFVNHHPHAIFKLLQRTGFVPIKVLSVSNLRFAFLKKILPIAMMNSLEKISQKTLSNVFFGPSIFVLAEKVDKE